MFKRLWKRFARLGTSLTATSWMHFSCIAATAVLFTVLAATGVLSHKPIRVVPNDYTGLKLMPAVDLEQKLRTKSPEIAGLTTFPGLRHMVVLGNGVEKDRIVIDAEVPEMLALAKAANVPVTSVPSASMGTGHNFWFWTGLGGIALWLGVFLFKKRDLYIPSRFGAVWERASESIDQYIEKKQYGKMNFWMTSWFITAGLLALFAASAVLHNSPVTVLPPEYASQPQMHPWQLERALQAYPKSFQRAVVIEDTNAVAVVLYFEDPSVVGAEAKSGTQSTDKDKEKDKNPQSVTLARVIQFESGEAGKAKVTDLVNRMRAREMSVKTASGLVKDGWSDTMSTPASWIYGIVGIGMVVILIAIFSKQDQWKANDQPTIKRNGAAAGGGGGAAQVQKPKIADKAKKTLKDVAGCDEAIAKLRLVVEWMKDAKAYEHYGAKLPNGVLLYGPPGTGKTLLARAVAGEVDGNFFHASASEFIEMYVGVGARRVRDFFGQGTAAYRRTGKLSVLFLDEIDAVGKRRSDGGTGGDSERDQTVNQLLTCIQGFDANSGCLLIAATNRPETLDEGLKRSGRFDFKIEVAKPDRKGRKAIFGVHGRKTDLEPGVDRDQLYDELSRRAHDFTGADIELAINEALTRAAKRNAHLFVGKDEEEIAKLPRTVSRADFHDGIDFVLYGELIKSRVRTDEERKATAVHEIGHATIPTVLRGDPVSRITIVMTTKSLGLMESHTEEERYGWSQAQFIQRIKTMLAGRAAEEMIANSISTGASNDFERASQLARFMVGIYGMSKLGPISIPLDEHGFPRANIGARLEAQFDEAWREIISECDKHTRELIAENRARIVHASNVLFEEETLTGDRFREVWAQTPVVADASVDPNSVAGQTATATSAVTAAKDVVEVVDVAAQGDVVPQSALDANTGTATDATTVVPPTA